MATMIDPTNKIDMSSLPVSPYDSYRALPTPLPSHPGLNSHSSSRKVSREKTAATADHANAQSRYLTPGALSTISSLLLLGPNTKSRRLATLSSTTTTRTTPPNDQEQEQDRDSSLLKRRGRTELLKQFHLNSNDPPFDDDPPSPLFNSEGQELDLPPSPIGLPGAWSFDNPLKDALLLPPPFLDRTSSKQSFEGLLGTREARARQIRLRKELRNYAKDRPPQAQFPQSLFKTASKLVAALGPPGGVDSGRYYKKWSSDDVDGIEEGLPGSVKKSRKRVERANSAIKGFELGEKYARKLADRLRSERTRFIETPFEHAELEDTDQIQLHKIDGPAEELFQGKFVTATPMSLLNAASVDQLSPPLLGFPTPGLDSNVSTLSSNEPVTPFEPPKAILKPILDDSGEPSPLPLMEEQEEPIKAEIRTSPIADGYFAIRRRRSLRKSAKELSMSVLDRLSGQANGRSTAVEDGQRRVSIDGVPLFEEEDALPRESMPATPGVFTLPRIESQPRPNLDLLIWILVGSPEIHAGFDQGLATVGGLIGLILHCIGFIIFTLVHTWSLLVSFFSTLRSIAFFSHWTFLNLTGRTDLSIVVKDYFLLCRKEWNTVSEEDGTKLSFGSVVLGLFEMMAVQAISKDRWIIEGPGKLVLLNEEDAIEHEDESLDSIPPLSSSPHALSRHRSSNQKSLRLDRPNLYSRSTSRRWTVDDGEGLIVTGGGDSILEGTIYNESVDPLAYASPSFTPHPGSATGFNTGIPPLNELDDLPPLDLGDLELNNTLPGFSFPPTPGAPSFISNPRSPPMNPLPEPQDEVTTFINQLRRHARLATASYGLHTYILAPPTPLFTPSGATLPHRVFSHLGGVDHKTVLHVAIQKHYTGLPAANGVTDEESIYEPQFYLLRDDLNGEIVCVVRGTQSLADIRTDLEADLEPVELPSLDPSSSGTETFGAHAGILAAARRLLDPQASPLFAKLKTALEEHPGYSLVLTGHSLGAAIASTLAFLIGQYTPQTPSEPTDPNITSPPSYDKGHWTISSSCGLPSSRPVRAICFAHPTTVSLSLASRCALGSIPLVISISYGPDAVCRMGIPQVREIRRVLGRLAKHRRKWIKLQNKNEVEIVGRKEKGFGITKVRKGMIHGKSEILTAWWRWKKLQGGLREVDLLAEDVMPLSEEEVEERKKIEEKAWRWRCEMDGIEDSLQYPQGKDEKTLSTKMIPCGKAYHIDRLPAELEKKRKQEMIDEKEERQRLKAASRRRGEVQDEEDDDDDDDDDESRLLGLYEVGSSAEFYACPLLEADLVRCHLPKEYLDSVNAL